MVGYNSFSEGINMAKQWTGKELEFVEKYVNTLSLKTISERLNKHNSDSGIKRSKFAIKKKLQEMGYSVRTTENNMTSYYWSKSLGLSKHTVGKWITRHGLYCEKEGSERKSRYLISRNAMTYFAGQNPHLFSGIHKDILLYYFGDNLTTIILGHKPPRQYIYKLPQKIKRTDTGEVYPSLSEASKSLGISKHLVKVQAQRNGWLRFA
jgi:hypothetical protein